MLTDMFAFLSNYKKHFLAKRNAKPAVNKLSGQKKMANTDILYDKHTAIVWHEPDSFHAMEVRATYNYKIPIQMESQAEVMCEIDLD